MLIIETIKWGYIASNDLLGQISLQMTYNARNYYYLALLEVPWLQSSY